MAESHAQAEEIVKSQKREGEGLKYLGFVQEAAMLAVVCLAALYELAREKAGPLKPAVSRAEGAVKAVAGPAYQRFRCVPFDFLKFADRKVEEWLPAVERHAPGVVKAPSAQAFMAAQKAPELACSLAVEVQRSGIAATASGVARDLYVRYEPVAKEMYARYESVAKEMYARYEPAAEQSAVAAWRWLNRVPLYPKVAQILLPTAAHWAERYNKAVGCAAGRGCAAARFLPTVPVERIAKVFWERAEKPSANGTAAVVFGEEAEKPSANGTTAPVASAQ